MKINIPPSELKVPFGKHKGRTVTELLEADPEYVSWLMAQGWLAERFAELHAALETRGAAPNDTPEHNALQARFLDERFRNALLWRIRGTREFELKWTETIKHPAKYKSWTEARAAGAPWTDTLSREERVEKSEIKPFLSQSARFEVGGIDVIMICNRGHDEGIELKPSIGDDFPSVIRQMLRFGSTPHNSYAKRCCNCVYQRYTGTSVSIDDVRKMFEANGLKLISVAEIEEEMRK